MQENLEGLLYNSFPFFQQPSQAEDFAFYVRTLSGISLKSQGQGTGTSIVVAPRAAAQQEKITPDYLPTQGQPQASTRSGIARELVTSWLVTKTEILQNNLIVEARKLCHH